MAHFAKLSKDNIVEQVIVVNNEILLNEDNVENEELGIQFCKSLFGDDTNWIQTSYNGNLRGKFAGIGMYYDSIKDEFLDVSENESIAEQFS